MTQSNNYDGRSADFTLANDRLEIHPAYNTDDPQKVVPDVWKVADRVRELIDKRGDPDKQGRRDLATAVTRQLRTVVLYWQVSAFYKLAAANEAPSKTMTVYVLLFPGEARDNTGIKDLNDKVLGYILNNKYVTKRQQKIHEIFHTDGFMVVGQDYKTAYFLTFEKTRMDFADRLGKLDKALREVLLNEILPEAEKEAKKKKDENSRKRLQEINKLRKTLEKNSSYKFDIFFGLSTVQPKGSITNATDVVFLLITEALKGAAIARFISKGKSLKTRIARRFVKGIKADHRSLDPRGKEYQSKTYLRASKKAGDIKSFMTAKPSADNGFFEYNHIYVDTVWTVAFIRYRRLYIGNPDVIRDVRKKKLKRPPVRQGNVKFTFKAQKDMLELWLVVLNLLDFVKDFVVGEFRREVVSYHDEALAVFQELRRPPGNKIDWEKLEGVLTRDLRLRQIAVLGTASEFQFYSFAADYSERIFFSMDIRDLGVDLMLLYENSNEEIEDRRLTGIELMEETFRSSDPIIERKRFTYDRVVSTFGMYHALLAKSSRVKRTDGKKESREAFGKGMQTNDKIPPFEESVQIMLGGDEVFVAAHPYFAKYVHNIISDLDRTPFKSGTLNMRAAVAYSKAEKVEEAEQRKANQISHNQAMELADGAPNILKELERTHRRIERLIEKLAANEKKKDLAPQFTKELNELGLTKLFGRVNHGKPKVMSTQEFNRLIQRFSEENINVAKEEANVELVDFNGRVVDVCALTRHAANLEKKVRQKVGRDNTHVDPPPVKKPPKVIDDILKDEE